MTHKISIGPHVCLGGEAPVLFAGPCLIEGRDMAFLVAEHVARAAAHHGFQYVFKGSFDKANRTSGLSRRTIGYDEALRILDDIRTELDIPTMTDVHLAEQVPAVAHVSSVIQIPAFLCRQTDLIVAAAASGKPVNIKKGQFMAPAGMAHAVEKARDGDNVRAFVTERGTSFGYEDLVVDFRSLVALRQIAPVVYDVTHSVQTPGSSGRVTGGAREYAPALARAAAAVGVDGFFLEVHPDPCRAWSDAAVQLPLEGLDRVLKPMRAAWEIGADFR